MKKLLLVFGLLLPEIALAQVPSYISTNGLIAFYPFSGNANDSSGNGHHGTAVGATLTNDRFGMPNRAYNLNSVGSKIDLLFGNFWLANDRTISFWVSSNPSGIEQRVLGYRPNCNSIDEQGFEFLLNAQNPIMEYWNAHSNGNQNPGPFVSGAWTHILVSKEDTIGRYYVNGTLQVEIHPIETITQNAMLSVSSGISCIANFPNNSNKRYRGKIDEIGLWNRALSTVEILNLYNTTTSSMVNINNQTFDVYPNPVSDQFTIAVNSSLIGQSFDIFDITGRRKMGGKITGLKTEVENIDLESGIYILAIDELRKRLVVD